MYLYFVIMDGYNTYISYYNRDYLCIIIHCDFYLSFLVLQEKQNSKIFIEANDFCMYVNIRMA